MRQKQTNNIRTEIQPKRNKPNDPKLRIQSISKFLEYLLKITKVSVEDCQVSSSLSITYTGRNREFQIFTREFHFFF